MSTKDIEDAIYGNVFPCPTHGGHCYNGWLEADGTWHHLPYLGWTCGGCYRSSSTPGQPLMFSDHRCGIGASLGAVLPPLVLGMALFLIVWMVARS